MKFKTLSTYSRVPNRRTGMLLENGDKVTAIFKLAYNNLDIYNLDNIIVTGLDDLSHNLWKNPLCSMNR